LFVIREIDVSKGGDFPLYKRINLILIDRLQRIPFVFKETIAYTARYGSNFSDTTPDISNFMLYAIGMVHFEATLNYNIRA
jgi:hypothetical protein